MKFRVIDMQSPLSFKKLSRSIFRFRKNTDGTAAIEFGIIAIPFFILLFAILEIGIAMFADQLLETGTQDVGRLIMTGQMQQSWADTKIVNGVPETNDQKTARVKSEFANVLCSKISALFSCAGVTIDSRNFPSNTTVSLPEPSNCNISAVFNMGNQDDLVIIRVFYSWPTYTTAPLYSFSNCSGNKRQFVATTAFRNDLFGTLVP